MAAWNGNSKETPSTSAWQAGFKQNAKKVFESVGLFWNDKASSICSLNTKHAICIWPASI